MKNLFEQTDHLLTESTAKAFGEIRSALSGRMNDSALIKLNKALTSARDERGYMEEIVPYVNKALDLAGYDTKKLYADYGGLVNLGEDAGPILYGIDFLQMTTEVFDNGPDDYWVHENEDARRSATFQSIEDAHKWFKNLARGDFEEHDVGYKPGSRLIPVRNDSYDGSTRQTFDLYRIDEGELTDAEVAPFE